MSEHLGTLFLFLFFFLKDYGRSVTDGELGKKMNEEKRRPSGCPKASNPYHVCNENCHKRMSGADAGFPPFFICYLRILVMYNSVSIFSFLSI